MKIENYVRRIVQPKEKVIMDCFHISIQAKVPFLRPLKKSENLWFFDVFGSYRNGILARNGLRKELTNKALMKM